ncbi:MAG TPA: metallophosphoesterase [Acidimicrobiales bacterium]
MIRVAAVGDVHFGTDSAGTLRPHLADLAEQADVLLLAGDLTRRGLAEEAQVLADELAGVDVPMFAVLGNHDYHSVQEHAVAKVMEGAGVRVLEGEGAVVDVDGCRLGIAGTKGFGGGFAGACGSDFGEPAMKSFIAYTRHLADGLESALVALADDGADLRVALLHYSPTDRTLKGERLEIYPFLGSYLLGEAVDRAGADLVVHGHAHAGCERGATDGGIEVRNVAQPLIGRPYSVFCLERPSAAPDDALVEASLPS